MKKMRERRKTVVSAMSNVRRLAGYRKAKGNRSTAATPKLTRTARIPVTGAIPTCISRHEAANRRPYCEHDA